MPRGDSRAAFLLPLLAALAGVACYAGTLGHQFVWDDAAIVLLNEHIRSLASIPALFTEHAFAGAANAVAGLGLAHYYRPLGMATLAIDHALWGDNAFGYHLTNVLLYAAACAGLADSLRLRLGRAWPAIAGAALFAAHPIHTEAVAWVSSRHDLLLALFVLVADGAWLRYRSSSRVRHAVVAGAAFTLALFSKETAIVLPLLLALEELRRGGGPIWPRMRRPAAFLVAGLAFTLVRFVLMPAPPEPVALATRVLTAPYLTVQHLWLVFVPLRPRVFHWMITVGSAASAAFLLPLAIALLFGVATVLAWRRDRDLGFGLAWIAVTVLPLAGLAGWPKPTPLGERNLLLPSAGWAIAAAALVARCAAGRARWVVAAAVLVVLAVFAHITRIQSRVWHDNLVLLQRIAHDAPKWATGREALAREYARAGRLADAIEEFRAAAELEPDNAVYRSNLDDAIRRWRESGGGE